MAFDIQRFKEALPVALEGDELWARASDVSEHYFSRDNHGRVMNWLNSRMIHDHGPTGVAIRHAMRRAH